MDQLAVPKEKDKNVFFRLLKGPKDKEEKKKPPFDSENLPEVELMDPAEYERTRSFITFFTSTIVIFTTFFTFFKGMNTYFNMRANTHQIQDLISNWHQKSITDIVVTSEQNCTQGYEELISYKWEGIDSGCSCVNKKFENEVKYGTCEKREGICLPVKEQPARVLDRMFGKLICAK